MADATRILLDESEIPRRWFNIIPHLPAPPPPPLHPGTHEPIGPDALTPLFPMALIGQEVSGEPYIDIPDEVLDIYSLWRPTPLYRARRLERALGTPAKIYYKYEGVSPGGLAQAQHRRAAGVLQRGRGDPAAHDRDRRRPVGDGAGVRVQPVRPGVRGVAGRGVVPPEAVPALDDGGVRRDGALVALAGHRVRAGAAGGRTPTSPARWASRSARRWRWRPRTSPRSTRWAACSTTCCCTRP